MTQAVATRAAIPAQVPFGPVYILQLATSYMNLALPTSLATMGIAVRFFQRQGVPPAAAVTSSTVNSVVNNAVQGVMLVALLAFSSVTLNLDIGAPSASGATHILFVLLGIAVIGAVVLGHQARRAPGCKSTGTAGGRRCEARSAHCGSPTSSAS